MQIHVYTRDIWKYTDILEELEDYRMRETSVYPLNKKKNRKFHKHTHPHTHRSYAWNRYESQHYCIRTKNRDETYE